MIIGMCVEIESSERREQEVAVATKRRKAWFKVNAEESDVREAADSFETGSRKRKRKCLMEQ
jgi:hypothetical protein